MSVSARISRASTISFMTAMTTTCVGAGQLHAGRPAWTIGRPALNSMANRGMWTNKFVQGAQAVVRFDSEADFAAQKISTVINTASNGINTSNAERRRATRSIFATGPWQRQSFAPRDAGVLSATASSVSVFLQDTWYPIKDLTVLAGLRYDRYGTNPNGIVSNPYFATQALWLLQHPDTERVGCGPCRACRPSIMSTPEQDFVPDTLITLRGGIGHVLGRLPECPGSPTITQTPTASICRERMAGIPRPGHELRLGVDADADRPQCLHPIITGHQRSACHRHHHQDFDRRRRSMPNFKLPPATLRIESRFPTPSSAQTSASWVRTGSSPSRLISA